MKIGILITVRTGSTRLPQKALLEVKGKTLLAHLVQRIKEGGSQAVPVIICTTVLDADYVLDSIAEASGVSIYHGDPDNIPLRHYHCAQAFGLDFVINVDGDDIFCNPEYIGKVAAYKLAHPDVQVIRTTGLPFGTNSMGYDTAVLKHITEAQQAVRVDTGWGELFNDSQRFCSHEIEAEAQEQLDARLTLDYEEDFLVFKAIIEALFNDDYVPQHEIITFLSQNEELRNSNKAMDRIYWENYEKKKKAEGR